MIERAPYIQDYAEDLFFGLENIMISAENFVCILQEHHSPETIAAEINNLKQAKLSYIKDKGLNQNDVNLSVREILLKKE